MPPPLSSTLTSAAHPSHVTPSYPTQFSGSHVPEYVKGGRGEGGGRRSQSSSSSSQSPSSRPRPRVNVFLGTVVVVNSLTPDAVAGKPQAASQTRWWRRMLW